MERLGLIELVPVKSPEHISMHVLLRNPRSAIKEGRIHSKAGSGILGRDRREGVPLFLKVEHFGSSVDLLLACSGPPVGPRGLVRALEGRSGLGVEHLFLSDSWVGGHNRLPSVLVRHRMHRIIFLHFDVESFLSRVSQRARLVQPFGLEYVSGLLGEALSVERAGPHSGNEPLIARDVCAILLNRLL